MRRAIIDRWAVKDRPAKGITMYIPKHFSINDWNLVENALRNWSFVDLLGISNNKVIISKNPVIYKGDKEVQFHLARGNPLLQAIKNFGQIELLISGPHEYISPTWYVVSPSVPTWNYVAIQMTIDCTIVNEENWLRNHHDDLVAKYEKSGWNNIIPDEYRKKMNEMLCGVSGVITTYEAKFKLGQNRSDEDYSGVYNGLVSEDPNNQLAKVMVELYPDKISNAGRTNKL
jgi:transcriptional regulator